MPSVASRSRAIQITGATALDDSNFVFPNFLPAFDNPEDPLTPRLSKESCVLPNRAPEQISPVEGNV